MSFPTTGLLDDFNRANAAPPSASWTDNVDGAATGLQLYNNTCTAATNAIGSGYWNQATFGPNCEVYYTVVTTDNHLKLFARISSPGASYNGYMVDLSSGGSGGIYKVTTGTPVQLGSNFSPEQANGKAFGLEVTGTSTTTLNVYSKPSGGSWGLWYGPVTDSSSPWTAAGYIGLGCWYYAARLDDFGGGTISAGGLSIPVAMNLYRQYRARLPRKDKGGWTKRNGLYVLR